MYTQVEPVFKYPGFDVDELGVLFEGVVYFVAVCFMGVFFMSFSLLASGRTEGGLLEF